MAFSLSPGLSVPQAAVLLCLPLAWLAGRDLAERGYLVNVLERGLPILLLVLLAWGLQQGPATFTAKPQGPFNDPNTYTAVLNLLALPILARYLAADLSAQTAWWRTTHLALLAASGLVSFLIASRGGTLALLLVLPPLLWLARAQPAFPRKLALLTVVAGVTILAAWQVTGGSSSVANRLINTVQGGDPSRIMLMRSAWGMIQDHPWLGSGLGTFRLLYPHYRSPQETGTGGGWVHNDYLQFWQEAGLPMFLLLLGLTSWVIWSGWQALRRKGPEGLLGMGYVTGVLVILVHALVNFIFYFALIGLVLGLYLARLSPVSAQTNVPSSRPLRLATAGYGLIMAILIAGQVSVEGLLGQAPAIQRVLSQWNIAYPRYQVAYWLSVLAPFHPTPQQVMGLELSQLGAGDGNTTSPLLTEALQRMDAAWRLAPCYVPYGTDALNAIHNANPSAELRRKGLEIARRNLACDPRHGLSFYYAGLFSPNAQTSFQVWKKGLGRSAHYAERLLIGTALLGLKHPDKNAELSRIAADMVAALHRVESNPGTRANQDFWNDAQYQLLAIAGPGFLEFVANQGARSQ